jgi:hypothetical protein
MDFDRPVIQMGRFEDIFNEVCEIEEREGTHRQGAFTGRYLRTGGQKARRQTHLLR